MVKKNTWIPLAVGPALLVLTGLLLIPGRSAGKWGTILCLGDSLTESRFGSYPPYLAHYARKYGYRLRVSLQAYPGYTSGEFLSALRRNGLPQLGSADIVLVMLGTNDVRRDHDHTATATFRRNLEDICDLIRLSGGDTAKPPELVLLTIPPIVPKPDSPFDRDSVRQAREEVVPTIRQLAQERDTEVIDIFGFFRRHPDLLPGIHPTPEGYRRMAAYIFRSLRPLIAPYQIRQKTGDGQRD